MKTIARMQARYEGHLISSLVYPSARAADRGPSVIPTPSPRYECDGMQGSAMVSSDAPTISSGPVAQLQAPLYIPSICISRARRVRAPAFESRVCVLGFSCIARNGRHPLSSVPTSLLHEPEPPVEPGRTCNASNGGERDVMLESGPISYTSDAITTRKGCSTAVLGRRSQTDQYVPPRGANMFRACPVLI